jgi:hypothetical protein
MLWVLLAGIGKEIFDSFGGGIVDFWDIIATVMGGLMVWLVIQIK